MQFTDGDALKKYKVCSMHRHASFFFFSPKKIYQLSKLIT